LASAGASGVELLLIATEGFASDVPVSSEQLMNARLGEESLADITCLFAISHEIVEEHITKLSDQYVSRIRAIAAGVLKILHTKSEFQSDSADNIERKAEIHVQHLHSVTSLMVAHFQDCRKHLIPVFKCKLLVALLTP